MDITTRKATEQDHDALAKLYDDLNLLHSNALPQIFVTPPVTPQNLEYVRAILKNKNAALFVAQSGGEIIGLIQLLIRESPDIPISIKRQYVYVEDICVKQEYRRSSAGKMLMKSAEEWALKKGISQIELNVWDFNRKAIAFFNSIGYSPAHHIMWKKIEKK
jgi:diamine N-acetyltransferase